MIRILLSVYLITYAAIVATLVVACGGGGGSAGGGAPAYVVVAPPPVATPAAATPSRDCTVALFGDSILHGENTRGPLAETPAQYIQRVRPAYTVVDNSVNGQGINATLPILKPARFTARFNVLEWGVNDPLQGYTDISGAYRQTIANVRLAGKVPIVTGIDTAYNNPSIIIQPKEVAADLKEAYAGWDDVRGTTIDGLHPDQVTSNVFSQKIVDLLDKLAPECGK